MTAGELRAAMVLSSTALSAASFRDSHCLTENITAGARNACAGLRREKPRKEMRVAKFMGFA